MLSPFSTAWRAFRHTFRDLSLLSWEERFDTNKTIQKARAQALGIEPYLYAKPAMGMPMGLIPQESGLGSTGDVMEGMSEGKEKGKGIVILGDAEDGYVRNEFGLPGVDECLGRDGVVGAALWRDAEEVRRREEAEVRRREEAEEAERKGRGREKRKKMNDNRSLLNGELGAGYADGNGSGLWRDMRSYAGSRNGRWGCDD